MNISISNYWKLPNDSSAFMSCAWFFLEEKYCLANTIVWFFSAEEFKHVTPTPNSWRKNRYVHLPNSDGRVKSSVMLHITCGCCVCQTGYFWYNTAWAWGMPSTYWRVQEHVLHLRKMGFLKMVQICFLSVVHRDTTDTQKNALPFMGKFAASGDLIWRNYQIAANAIILLKVALALE